MAANIAHPIDLNDIEGLAQSDPSQLMLVWRRFRRHRLALIGMVVLLLIILLCIFVPPFTGYDYVATNWQNRLADPSPRHLLGTDGSGRDMLTRLLMAGRISLFIGLCATIVAVTVGALLGALAGYKPGLADTVIMRIVDLLLSLPDLPVVLVMSILLQIALADWRAPAFLGFASFETKQIVILTLVMSMLGWLGISRVVRSGIIAVRSNTYIEATRALGAGPGRILFRHMIPNALAPLIVAATLATSNFLILEATLSFLGFGVDPRTPSWGNMLTSVQEFVWNHPFLAFYPGVLILLTVLSINFIGDALRDALDPRLKR